MCFVCVEEHIKRLWWWLSVRTESTLPNIANVRTQPDVRPFPKSPHAVLHQHNHYYILPCTVSTTTIYDLCLRNIYNVRTNIVQLNLNIIESYAIGKVFVSHEALSAN